ncbi:unnamed protein product [Penicillium roqueforti FM164]|uniref:Genomic scaffold, ProqFM164S01 n=1 Tax=Penicillium roqueforti (strain FM164) TaxID=1365484 RepID=W6PWG7_PENRF|nr:unnamed protein product [Penicillium roqueforti FM164]
MTSNTSCSFPSPSLRSITDRIMPRVAREPMSANLVRRSWRFDIEPLALPGTTTVAGG